MRRHLLVLGSIVNFSGLVFIWILQNHIGERTGPTALLTYVPQHGFGVLSLLLAGWACYARRRRVLAFNGVSMGLFAFLLLGFQLPSPQFRDEKTIRVMTYNVLGKQADAEKIAAEIRRESPDVVCLQESAGGFGERVAAMFPGWHSESAGDVTTFSRYPLLSSEIWPFRGTRRILETRWQTPDGALRVLNTHISTSYDGRGQKGNSRIKRILTEARPVAMVRLQQLPYLKKAAQKDDRENEATIMCGDFNTPPRGLFYRELCSEWSEAFAQSGFGLGATYPRAFPLLRIDYVWMKNGVQSKRTFVPEANGSDHLPVVCDFVLQR